MITYPAHFERFEEFVAAKVIKMETHERHRNTYVYLSCEVLKPKIS